MSAWVQQLNDIPLAGLMLVVALGYTIGRLSWRGMSLGPAGGTMGIAILLGSMGLDLAGPFASDAPMRTVGGFGFALFIYSVGFEAGPRFFASLRGGPGWRFVAVGTLTNVLAVGVAIAGGLIFGLGDSITAGVLAGGITSAPTYAAALEVCSDRAALAVSFALVYPVGLVSIVLMIQFLPRFVGCDLTTDEEDEGDDTTGLHVGAGGPELTRVFEVRIEDVTGVPLAELGLPSRTGCYLTRVHRGEEFHVPSAGFRLEVGDHVLVRGRLDELRRFGELVGTEVYDHELRKHMPRPRRVLVLSREVVGRSLADLDLGRAHGCLVLGIERGRVMVEPSAETCLERTDVLEVVGRRRDVRALAERLGRVERPTHETDIAVYAGGILVGLLLGRLSVHGSGFDVTLGTAGGLLLSGILMGRFRHVGPFRTHVPRAARQLVRDLGILLFVAEAGVKAGGSSLAGIEGTMWPMLGAGLAVAVVPVLVAVIFARRMLKMRPVHAWGSVSGGMTSSAALVALKRAADSEEPALSYAAAYAMASVLVTIAGQVVVFMM